jgi:hypothetical protein
MVSSGMLRRVALVRTNVSEEPSASFMRVTRIGFTTFTYKSAKYTQIYKHCWLFINGQPEGHLCKLHPKKHKLLLNLLQAVH